MESTVIQRVKDILKVKQMNVSQLAKVVDMPQVTVNNYIIGKRKCSFELVEKLARCFPDISQQWLLTGEGDMINADKQPAEGTQTKPRLPITAAAGMLSEYIGGIYKEQCERLPVIHTFPAYDFTILVKGDSMEPKFEGGDEIACKRVEKTIEWGKTYIVDTNDGAFLKRIYDEGESIRCVSYNKEYSDFLVNKMDINGIYRVVGLLRF